MFALLFGDQNSGDSRSTWIKGRASQWAGHKEQRAGADLFDSRHQSSSLITSNTRDTEREAGWAAGIFSASPPSRGQPETHRSSTVQSTRGSDPTTFPRHLEITPDLIAPAITNVGIK
jgi:hypothetical protein